MTPCYPSTYGCEMPKCPPPPTASDCADKVLVPIEREESKAPSFPKISNCVVAPAQTKRRDYGSIERMFPVVNLKPRPSKLSTV